MAIVAKFKIAFSEDFKRILKRLKKKDRFTYKKVTAQIVKIVNNPISEKPLRNVLRNYRRVPVGSFVLIYEIYQQEIRFLDYDHHDKIYKKKFQFLELKR